MLNPAPSPITVDLLLSGAVGIAEVVVDGTDVWWGEARPNEAGRTALMRWRDGEVDEITKPHANVRTRVHEYGGGAWWVDGGWAVYSDDTRGGELFLLDVESGATVRLTTGGHRYADGRFTPDRAWYVCVRERHDLDAEVVHNEVVAVAVDGSGEVRVLAAAHDFYAHPRVGPDGRVLCVAWDQPSMPWDTTTLVSVSLDGGDAESPPALLTGAESIVLHEWTSDGRLLAVTDATNWWNLVEVDPETGDRLPVIEGEFEIATPGWVFGISRWCEIDAGIVVVAGGPRGDTIGFPDGFVEDRHSSVSSIRALDDGRVAYVGASWDEEPAVWIHDGQTATCISGPRDLGLDPSLFPEPTHETFDVSVIDPSLPSGTTAHALFYAPTSGGGRPPLLVLVHGGPTAAARRQLDLKIRYWTSRGVAVADVDYRGSTLYGRRYRQELLGQWGHADVVDCVAAAKHLADTGRVDPDRMVIAGGSAGGLTVLNALALHDVFSGGICRYGVTDLRALAEDTHKFEARYLDGLVGPWPEAEEIYLARSPISHVDSIDRPLLVLQGTEDKIVPPSQSELIVDALRNRDIPVTYHLFEGEGHGFRQADTIAAVLRAEESFIFGL